MLTGTTTTGGDLGIVMDKPTGSTVAFPSLRSTPRENAAQSLVLALCWRKHVPFPVSVALLQPLQPRTRLLESFSLLCVPRRDANAAARAGTATAHPSPQRMCKHGEGQPRVSGTVTPPRTNAHKFSLVAVHTAQTLRTIRTVHTVS